MWEDSEGGNIRIMSPNDTEWQMDAFNNTSFRIYTKNGGITYSFKDDGTFACKTLNANLPWSKITDKPSTYTPADHTHDYILDNTTRRHTLIDWGKGSIQDVSGMAEGTIRLAVLHDRGSNTNEIAGIFPAAARSLIGAAATSHTHTWSQITRPSMIKIGPNEKVRIFEDVEGGNIEITSPNGTLWIMDAIGDSYFRIAHPDKDTINDFTFFQDGGFFCGHLDTNYINILNNGTINGKIDWKNIINKPATYSAT